MEALSTSMVKSELITKHPESQQVEVTTPIDADCKCYIKRTGPPTPLQLHHSIFINTIEPGSSSSMKSASCGKYPEGSEGHQVEVAGLVHPESKCYLLRTLPVEVRNGIYRELLISEDLGTAAAIGDFGKRTTTYGLSPAILRTCKQIHDEASDVLYKENTFYIACVEKIAPYFPGPAEHMNLCALTRYLQNSDTRVIHRRLENIPCFTKVKKWCVLMSQVKRYRDTGASKYLFELSWSLEKFCQAICHTSPQSIEVLIIPSRMEPHHDPEIVEISEALEFLQPLEMLHQVGRFSIRRAQPADVDGLKLDYPIYGLSEFNDDIEDPVDNGSDDDDDDEDEMASFSDRFYGVSEENFTRLEEGESEKLEKIVKGNTRRCSCSTGTGLSDESSLDTSDVPITSVE